MKKSHKVLLALLGVIVLAVVVFKAMQPNELEYQGRKLSEWIEDYSKVSLARTPEKEKIAQFEEAFKRMGAKAIPWTEAQINRSHNPVSSTPFQTTLTRVLIAAGIKGQESIVVIDVPEANRYQACFFVLETIGDDAIPALERLMRSPSSTLFAASSLAKLDAIRALERAAEIENKDFVRQSAAFAFGRITTHKDRACDNLLLLAKEADPRVVQAAAQALGELNRKPAESVVQLRELLRQNNQVFQFQVITSLGRFGSNAVPAIPDLEKAKLLGSPNMKALIEDTIREIKSQ